MTREEAIKQMEEFMVIDDWSLVYLPDLHDALELAIEALTENESLAKSVIEASELLRKKRPHGEWIKFTLEGGFLSSHKCSKCGFNGNQLWHFCPSCGADMRKEGEASAKDSGNR